MVRQRDLVSVNILLQDPQDDSTAMSTPRQMLDLADIVYAVAEDQDEDILVFGKEKLARIASSDIPEGARVLRVGYDHQTNQLDSLLSLVASVKGSHDYAESL